MSTPSLRLRPLLAALAAVAVSLSVVGPARAVEAVRAADGPVVDAGRLDPAGARDSRLVARRDRLAGRAGIDWIARVTPDVPEPAPRSVARDTSTSSQAGAAYRGRDHVWIPALGIDRSVAAYACSSAFYPGDRVYRWGCAGARNVYLFGHAHSVFQPLHDAYVRGRLAKGMRVVYADGDGRIATYAVTWWRVTTPDDGAWAYAAQSSPSLTLQTCVGADSQFRLIVRLAKVD